MEAHIGYIKNGVNLDHIPQGNAWYVIRILGLEKCDNQVGIGLNLPSKKLGRKDLIKIEQLICENFYSTDNYQSNVVESKASLLYKET